ncbi:unnamed protein product [Durusdinium trenchii]|uniref:Sushi domain-containing protein n=1 Tax=Durusdinium trenchii TaxID=1381693 RepID=A0ABP0IY82_9DINO
MSQVDVVLLQFAMGTFALAMRYCSRPLLSCCRRCGLCFHGWLCCICNREPAQSTSTSIGDFYLWFSTYGAVRWYWFHLAIQLGFISREFQVISAVGTWPFEVKLSFCAICLTYLVVLLEVYNFSSVRSKDVVTKITVDGLLDMILLPVNIGLFGHLCVRKLSLQGQHHSVQVISTIAESSEIWEAWALWSVLGLFVTVVDVESQEDAERRSFVKPFRNLSLQGVRTWVFIIMAISVTRLATTFLEHSAPSLCFWVSKSCMSCTKLYEDHIHLAAAAVNFILCSFALAFVFTFEHTFDEYLRRIGPFWKFWGVKGVVSVTYFQWLVLSYGPFHFEQKRIYLLHCLLTTVEMPILAVIHSCCAYPFGKPWLEYLLKLQQKDMEEAEAEASDRRMTVFWRDPEDTISMGKVDSMLCCFYLLFWIAGCIGAHSFVVFVLPVNEMVQRPPMFNVSCTKEGDIWQYVENNHQLHYRLKDDTLEKHRLPNVGGAWLHLCDRTELDCEPGFQGSPILRCSPSGTYDHRGFCRRTRCGQPKEEVGHARLHSSGQTRWTSDMEITYECQRGFTGQIQGICGKDGVWRFEGECKEVICPSPPVVPRAKPLLEPHELEYRTWQAGTSLHYQCEEPFTGSITATCEDDGTFLLSGRCLRQCNAPPKMPNSVAIYENQLAIKGFFEGLRVTYQCSPGYGGTLIATCREDGNFSVEGGCKLRCGGLESFLEKQFGVFWKDDLSTNQSGTLDFTGTGEADLVPLRCSMGLAGQPLAVCHEGGWRLLGDPCQLFRTSSGCRCKRQWKLCQGLLQNNCKLWHGCHDRDGSSWCEVESSSCGQTSWDYCVGQSAQEDPEERQGVDDIHKQER